MEDTEKDVIKMSQQLSDVKIESEELLKEERERERRKNNMIIFNIPEPEDPSREGRKRADTEKVLEIIQICESDITELDFDKISRIGIKKDDKSRPIMVSLKEGKSEKKKSLFISLAKLLESNKKEIKVAHDMTIKQREEHKELLEEAKKGMMKTCRGTGAIE